MLEFLNSNSGLFNLIFSGVVALSTVIYAVLTWKLVDETRKMREIQTEPKIAVTAEIHEKHFNFMNLKIQNIGLGPAYNIRLSLLKDFEYDLGEFVSEMGFIKNGIRYLFPGQKIETFLTSMLEDYERKIKDSFEIEVIYQNAHGKDIRDVYEISFSYFMGLSKLGASSSEKISRSIDKIEGHIKDIARQLKKAETKGEL